MEMNEIIEQAKENIHRAIADYRRHTCDTEVLDGISDAFIDRLAEDSSRAKQGLRELFSRSPVWDPELDALVINGTRTHNPDPYRIRELAYQILNMAKAAGNGLDPHTERGIVEFFADPNSASLREERIAAIVSVNPAHFLTMSNPKNDRRGSTLTSRQ